METSTVVVLLYLFTRIDVLHGWNTAALVVTIGAIVVYSTLYLIVRVSGSEEEFEDFLDSTQFCIPLFKKVIIPIMCVSISISILVPNQRDLMVVVGGALGYHGVTAIASDSRVQETGGAAVELLNGWLNQQIVQLESTETVDN